MKKKVLLLSTLLFSQLLLAQEGTFFIGANLGLSNYDYEKKDIQSSVDISTLDRSTFLIDADIGYRFSDSIFTTLNYQRVNFNEINFNNYYASLNYQLSDVILKPYAGFIYGTSQMKLDKLPINSTENDLEATSNIYGLQLFCISDLEPYFESFVIWSIVRYW